MVKHIVLWSFKEGVDKEKSFGEIKAIFDEFSPKVPGMQSLKLVRGYQGYDVCLISVHDSKEALEVYQKFPQHLEVKEVIKAVRDQRASCDFEI